MSFDYEAGKSAHQPNFTVEEFEEVNIGYLSDFSIATELGVEYSRTHDSKPLVDVESDPACRYNIAMIAAEAIVKSVLGGEYQDPSSLAELVNTGVTLRFNEVFENIRKMQYFNYTEAKERLLKLFGDNEDLINKYEPLLCLLQLKANSVNPDS